MVGLGGQCLAEPAAGLLAVGDIKRGDGVVAFSEVRFEGQGYRAECRRRFISFHLSPSITLD